MSRSLPRPTPRPEPPLRVLVIEDDLIFQKIIQTYLTRSASARGKVTLAGGLEEGLRELEAHEHNAVLLDLTLPDSSGPETLQRFQARAAELGAADVPVIVLTGLDDDAVAAEAVRHGAQDFLVKSDLSASILLRAVRYAIERVKAEQALRESEARFRAVVEDQTELVCRFRAAGELSFVNPAFCRYFHRDHDTLLGADFFALTGVDPASFRELDAHRPTRSREQHLVRAGARPTWIQWTDRALFDERDRTVGFQSVGRDCTEQKDLERQLFQSQKMESLGRLAGGVAHDFNNLLTVIIACCEVLSFEREQEGLGPHPQIGEIEQAAERAAALTRQLLAVSRRHVAQPTVLDLNQVVRQTEEMVRRLIGEPVQVVVRLDPEVRPIRADRAQIEQILVNLVVNARDAMPAGGQLVIETAAVGADGGAVTELAVADTGVGIDPATQEKIFEPFFTTKDAGRGSGLGLSIVDSMVKQSGGSITVASAPGRGARFAIRFPACDEAPHASWPAAGGRRAASARSGSILLVEDEALVRSVVTSLLEPQGFQVKAAANVAEALALLDGRNHFDVVLTDVVLPDRNGFQLADVVKERFPDMRILFMSGYTDTADGERWLEDGAVFLQKPFSAAELLAKLDHVMRPT